MYEWNEAVQRMIDWLEQHIAENPTLIEMSEQIGYSPYYCSTQFHRICGLTMKSYLSGRRLARAALDIRDTRERIIDIAMKYGFSSQEALTRAFRETFGCTPASYRRNPIPVPLPIYKVIFFPEHYQELYRGGKNMEQNNTRLKSPNVRIEYIPAHKYIGIWDTEAKGYGSFFAKHNCDEVCGIINSMSNVSDMIITPHTAGWHLVNEERRYFYGLGVPVNYNGEVPDGFEIREIPGSYYLVFFYPPFDYLKDNANIMSMVENLAWNYDITTFQNGKYIWNQDCQCYQRHYPEVIGYEVLRPITIASEVICNV